MMSCANDAREEKYIVVTCIPGTFLHIDMVTDVHMLLEGTIAELIVKLKPRLYWKSILKNRSGKPMIYV